ncbi:MAG: 8-oxo-dGTP diphosphatase [Clostridia bacterium]|nr:8-oxo-dGTP diphosphatase [Clostridia bacterium]MDN5366401.1 8-oxo-dGTP diphosphatase [Thermacetogenium sp.]MDN5375744.1 8-oxo-dGTP diphosphatase [Thermacetogenium sp.]
MRENHVVTCFLEHGGEVLVLKRSSRVGSYQQRWAGISGYIEEGNTPLKQALIELREEAGLQEDGVVLVKVGLPLEVVDEKLAVKWVVHPFRFRLEDRRKIALDWEHTECRWVNPAEIRDMETVPGLQEAWERVQ